MKVLLIEDNVILSRNVAWMFAKDDIFTEVALDGNEGYRKAVSKYFDVIVLDANLPWMSGFEICKRLREEGKEVGIIMLTSMSDVDSIVEWLGIWADDYLTKPFEYKELLSRIQVIKRRKMKNSNPSYVKIGDLELDVEKYEARNGSERIPLSRTEFELLKTLALNKGKVLSRKELFELVWWEADSDFLYSRTLDVHIRNLRKKIWDKTIETRKWIWFVIN